MYKYVIIFCAVPSHILYNEWNLQKLETLDYKELPELTQIQIISDIGFLALDDLVPIPFAFEIYKRLLNNTTSRIVWNVALYHLRQINQLLQNTPAQKSFEVSNKTFNLFVEFLSFIELLNTSQNQ